MGALREIYEKLLPLLAPPPEPPRQQIGFSVAQAVAVAGDGDSGKSTYDPAEQHASK
jgi:hypothetical protein